MDLVERQAAMSQNLLPLRSCQDAPAIAPFSLHLCAAYSAGIGVLGRYELNINPTTLQNVCLFVLR